MKVPVFKCIITVLKNGSECVSVERMNRVSKDLSACVCYVHVCVCEKAQRAKPLIWKQY